MLLALITLMVCPRHADIRWTQNYYSLRDPKAILLFIAWFICSRRWFMDKLGVFHADQTSMRFWATSELRVRLAHRETGLSPLVKYFYWPFQGGTSFVDHLCYLCLVFAMYSLLFIVALWADLLALVCDFLLPIGILGQVWNLIVSIPDPCCLSYFEYIFNG